MTKAPALKVIKKSEMARKIEKCTVCKEPMPDGYIGLCSVDGLTLEKQVNVCSCECESKYIQFVRETSNA